MPIPQPPQPRVRTPGELTVTEGWLVSVGGVRQPDGGISFGRLEWRVFPPGWYVDGQIQAWAGPVTRDWFRRQCESLGVQIGGV